MPHASLWAVFADSAARFGDRTAIEVQRADRLDRFTYRELHDLASSRAAWLASKGIGKGNRCAILADNDAHWCAAYLGILKLGAVAVPLDTNYSAEQVTTIVRDSGAKVLFVSEKLKPNALEAGIELLELHASASAPSNSEEMRRDRAEAARNLDDADPAVILYTSGTTSDPKGVVLTHGNLRAERDAAFSVVTVTDRDAVLGVLPLFHSLAQLANLLLPFAVGARVVYLETINSTDLIRALTERQITIVACVPQFFDLIHQRVTQQAQKSGLLTRVIFNALLGVNFRLRRIGINLGPLLFGKVHDAMGRDLRLLVTGGSKFDPAVGRDLYALGFTILQAYGLTETSAAATINRADEAHLDTVGRALPGVDLRIDDTGEIQIRGPIVMQGYYNRPGATAAVMRDGWFLTGDLGHMDEAGRVTITGRKKDIIVLASGTNIYPEEVEAHYGQSPFVQEICVMGLAESGRPSSERLHAVVVPNMALMRERKIVNAGDILRFELEGLSAALPAHKRVFGYDVSFEPLPRTTTQKLKRNEVLTLVRERSATPPAGAPLPAEDQAWLDQPHAAAAAPLIQARAKGARLRPDANLELDLGLDSMERVELLTELEGRFGIRVPQTVAVEIFTVRQLVEATRSAAATRGENQGRVAKADRTAKADHSGSESWAGLLRDLPHADDSQLAPLLRRRTFVAPIIFALLRLLRLLLFRVRVAGLEKLPASGPYIISPNHQSYVDPFVLCGVLPYRVFRDLFFVGAVEYFETPLTRWVARTANLVPVDPDSNLVPAMKAGAFGLAHGKILMLFPEGERSIDGTVKKFKKGAPILAQHLGVPIVPVALKGIYEWWPRNQSINWTLLAPWSGHHASIEIGEPMTLAETANYTDSAAGLRERVSAMWTTLSS